MSYEFQKGLKRGMDGKCSANNFFDEILDAKDAERERGYEAGITAKALADAIAARDSSQDFSYESSDQPSYTPSCASSTSSTSTESGSGTDVLVSLIVLGVCAILIYFIVVVVIGASSSTGSDQHFQSSTPPDQNYNTTVAPPVNPGNRFEERRPSVVAKPQQANPANQSLVDGRSRVSTPSINKSALRHNATLDIHSNGRPTVVWSDGYVDVWADNNSRRYPLNPQSRLRFPNSSTIHAVPRSRDATTLYYEPN